MNNEGRLEGTLEKAKRPPSQVLRIHWGLWFPSLPVSDAIWYICIVSC